MVALRKRLFPARRRPPAAAPPPKAELTREHPAQLLKRLEFTVLRRLDGFLFGDYRGLFYGPSLDLAEVREYQPGDEVRRIDWNVTARTGNLHVRQYREEREIIAWLIVDLSPSMRFGTRRVLKLEAALEFVGLAAAIITRSGNKVGAIGFGASGVRVTPLGSGRRQALAILHDLMTPAPERAGANGVGADLAGALAHASRTLRRRALVFVVSDFLTPGAADLAAEPVWAPELRRLAYHHDLIAVRVSDPAERALPRAGDLRLRDPETGEELWIDTGDPAVRRAHAALVARRDETFGRIVRSARVDALPLSTEAGVIEPVLAFTARRRGRRS